MVAKLVFLCGWRVVFMTFRVNKDEVEVFKDLTNGTQSVQKIGRKMEFMTGTKIESRTGTKTERR